VLQEVVWDVKNRIRGRGKFKKNDVNVDLCSNWGIVQDICLDRDLGCIEC
jgi:hypothetical protein